jgi:hypothetical protein
MREHLFKGYSAQWQSGLLRPECHCALVGRQNRCSRSVAVEKTSISYGTNFAVAKQSGGWTRSERFGDDAGIVI